MKPDHRVRRAAGVIMWRLKEGEEPSKALADASARETTLTEEQLRYAYRWALAAMAFAEECNKLIKPLSEHEQFHGRDWKAHLAAQDRCNTIRSLRDRAGLTDYCEGDDCPEDEA